MLMKQKLINQLLRLVIAGLLMLFSIHSFSQVNQKKITGIIIDTYNAPIIGATVVEKGTMNATITDLDGRFELELIQTPATLEIRMVGYTTLEVPAESKMELTLEEDIQLLDELVVIGYGSVKSEDLTGSVSAIKAEEINRGAINSSYELLRGKVSGVLVLPNGQIRIRGLSSLNASNDPLVVVDGVPLNYNGLSSVNPDDIETFTVLKDASAAAIYGSRAAGGVILVTTKKPVTDQKLKVSYNGTSSIRHYIGKTDVMDADEFRGFVRNLYTDSPTSLALANSLMGDENIDWIDEVTQIGIGQTHNLALSGTVMNGQLPYRVAAGFIHNRGTVKGDWSGRPSLSVNLSPNFLDKHLSVNINAKVNRSFSDDGNASYGNATNFNPTVPIHFYNEDGTIDYGTNQGFWIRGNGRGENLVPASNAETNPLQFKTTQYDYRKNYGYVASSDINYQVHGFEDLSFKLTLGIDGTSYKNRNRTHPEYWGLINDGVAPRVGTYYTESGHRENKILESYANYKHDFNKHSINVIAGYSWQHFQYYDTNETRLNGNYDNEASDIHYEKDELYGSIYKHGEEHFLVSFYSRLNYSYQSKYLMTLTLRNDGSSRFAPGNRWGLFPSLALAWNVKRESFLENVDLFSQLKFRAGWGITGQESGIANYSYLANYNLSTNIAYMYHMGSDGLKFSLTPAAYDPNIKWEETVTLNVGMDFGLFNGSINGNVDLYKRKTNDLLNTVTIPLGANFSNSLLTNIGNIKNKGLEIGLNYHALRRADMYLDIGMTGTFEETEFTRLTIGDESDNADYYIPVGGIGVGTGGYLQQQKVGYSPRIFYTYQQVYDANGNAIQNALVDRDGNGLIDDNDRYLSGKKPLPDFYYGLNLKFGYKEWDFGFNGHGSKGNWVFNNYRRGHSTTANDNLNYNRLQNFHRTVLTTGWTSTSRDPQNYSDYWLEDASFFKIDDVNLGYTFKDILNTRGSSLRLAATVNNVLTITNYSGVDPEIGSDGVDGRSDPRIRTYTLRATLNF